ncbi:MAG: fumarylacetoacetate hydrolase family protein [Thermoanaerobaculia bacterium]|nr:fumarylacetoacetate hydrolase family protein [Thermoanaerobaculia bacterium]
MLLYRLGSESRYAIRQRDEWRWLESDPWHDAVESWRLGSEVAEPERRPLAPVRPSKIIGIGRNYVEHAAELGNAMPTEPLIFLKAPSSIIGPGEAIVLPPESERVELEGEIGLVIGRRLRRGSRAESEAAILGVTAANDVTARDLQRSDKTFARGKSFDTFCPLGPAILVRPDLGELRVETRLDQKRVQEGHVDEMAWDPVTLVEYVSRHMTLEPGDLLLTGTPAGVTPLHAGQTVEVEVSGLDVLRNQVVSWSA